MSGAARKIPRTLLRRLVDLRRAVARLTERISLVSDASANRTISPVLGGDVEREPRSGGNLRGGGIRL